MEPDERACPYCAETIKVAAKKCRWCGEFLDEGASTAAQPTATASSPMIANQAAAAPPQTPTTETREQYLARMNGTKLGGKGVTGSSEIVCPYCQKKGFVKTKAIKQKKGISGAKATGAVFTMGVSILATGLSRKEKVTQLTCGSCKMTWTA
jgi:DNA-directed RNA polymerase subunit RPC12/RpoP